MGVGSGRRCGGLQIMSKASRPELALFLDALTEPDDIIELRPLIHGKGVGPGQTWRKPGEIASMNGSLDAMNVEASVYFGVNPRDRVGGSKDEHVSICRCVFVDFDDGMTPDRAIERITSAGLPHPTATVSTGGGVHCYWRLTEPIDKTRFREIQAGLIAKLGSDDKIKDAPRIMRLPGTVNRKPGRGNARCEVVEIAGKRHNSAHLADLVVAKQPASAPVAVPSSHDNRERRCRRYIESLPDSISGQGGSDVMFQVAAETARFGLGDAAAWRVLEFFNRTKCDPVWSRAELEHKFQDGRKAVIQEGKVGSRLVEGAAPRSASDCAGDHPSISNVRIEFIVDANGNPVLDKNGDQETQAHALTPGEVRDSLLASAGDVYTLGVDGPLFVPSTTDESAIRILKDPPELFAWIKSKTRVYWRGKADVGGEVTSKAEIAATLRAEPAASFDQVATLPHHPAISRTYYAHPDLPKATGERLAEFISRLNPASDIDRDLLKAFILTPAWGGPAGGRPLFVLTSEHGRGAGKTATASAIGQLYQGALSVSLETRDGIERLRQRILSPANAALRCVVLDNVKSAASSGEIESLITADVIDGHRLHHGDARRPNSLTWALTANGVGLSRDLADRSVLIRLGEPKRSDFASWAAKFIADHRLGLIADVLDELQGPPKGSVEPGNRDRWSAWQDSVLACLPNANALAAEIIERRGGVDADAEDWFSVKHEIEQLVAAAGHAMSGPVFIPSSVLCERLGHIEGLKMTGRGLATMLNRFTGVADAARLQRSSSRAHGHGRGYVWMPEDREQASRQVSYPAWQYLDPITLRQRRDT